jgi:hypothetical protein
MDKIKVNGPEAPCPACGRIDVPICPDCGNRVPHGFTVGTSLPCMCKGYCPADDDLVLTNVVLEYQSRKEVKK